MQHGYGESELPLDASLEQDLPADHLLQHFHSEAAFPRQLDVLQGRGTRPAVTTHGGVRRGKRRRSQLPGVVLGQRTSVGALLEHAQLQSTARRSWWIPRHA